MRPGVHPVIRAEQALLGSALAHPGAQAWLLDLVNADDMTRPYHGQVLGAMQRVRGRGAEPDPVAVREELGKDPDLPRLISNDGVLLADLMEAAPRSDHGPAYAAMVISTGIRRRAELAASRMRQAAESRDAGAALRMARQARGELDRCRARWEALPEPMRRELPASPSRRRPADITGRLATVRDEIHGLRHDLSAGSSQQLAGRLASIARQVADVAAARPSQRERQAGDRLADPEAEDAGLRALRDLAAAPSRVAAVRGWLQPEHFTRASHGELYAVMVAMTDAGKPVDPVTVTWEAARRGVVLDAADLAGGTGPFAVASAREVRRHGVLAQVARLAREIEATAADPASSPAALWHAAERLGRNPGELLPHRHHAAGGPARPAGDREPAREAAS
jgi:DnaB-like helicase N terminal domain